MSQLYINTVQNVSIEQVPASIAERILAHVIDYALFGGYSLIFLVVIGNLVDSNLVYMIIASLPMVFYDLVCEITMNGQSAGKKVMGLRVVREDGSEPDLVSYFLRWVFRLFDTIGTFGTVAAITTIANGKGKRLGDIVAGTRIIRLKGNIESSDLLPAFAPDYKPIFETAVNLNDNDIQVLREVLDFAKNNPNTSKTTEMLNKTKMAIEKKLQISSDWYSYNFLERIVIDYTYMNLSS